VNESRSATSPAIELARQIASDVAEFAEPHRVAGPEKAAVEESRLPPADDVLMDYDRRILDEDLRIATRSRFVSKHYADAIEAGVKVLNETVRQRTGRTEDGDDLMRIVFSTNGALLRINDLRSKSDQSAQRGHMLLCQGVVGAWRNPRAHSLTDDSPSRTIMMLELIDDLLRITKKAVRTRKRRNS
jgi:uncharacterized protein (TIGR02391 family)